MASTVIGTPDSDSLCRDIAKRSKGVCFLGLSGGKDSLCAWLNLRRRFKRIIPFHCTSWPGMAFERQYFDYLQDMMGTRILRLVGEDYPMALTRMMYQPWKDADMIADMPILNYSKLDILEYLRYKFNLPNAWCAFGISASDSIDRAIYCKRTGGKNPANKTFYPCYDWPRKDILQAVIDSGLKLPSSYRYVNRTMGNVPGIVTNEILKKHYPEDWQRFLALYPLAEAKTVREHILDREWAAAKKRRIEEAGGTAAADLSADEGEDDGSFEGEWMEDTAG